MRRYLHTDMFVCVCEMLRFTSSLSPYGRRRSQEKWELLGVHLASPLELLCFKVSQQKSRGRAAVTTRNWRKTEPGKCQSPPSLSNEL